MQQLKKVSFQNLEILFFISLGKEDTYRFWGQKIKDQGHTDVCCHTKW